MFPYLLALGDEVLFESTGRSRTWKEIYAQLPKKNYQAGFSGKRLNARLKLSVGEKLSAF